MISLAVSRPAGYRQTMIKYLAIAVVLVALAVYGYRRLERHAQHCADAGERACRGPFRAGLSAVLR